MSFGGGTQVGSIQAVIGLNASQFLNGIRSAQSALTGLASSATSNLNQVGGAASTALDAFEKASAGIAGAFTLISGAALKASADVSSAMNQIRVATGATGPQLDALNASFEKIGSSVPNSLGDVGKALAMLSQRTGLTGDALKSLTIQELNLQTITGGNLDDQIRVTTRLFGDWGIATDKQAGTLDSLFRASQKTGITVGDLSRQLTYYGAPLRELGIGFDQAAALVGKFENEGVNAKLVLGALRVELTRSSKGGVTDLAKGFEQVATAIKNAKTTAEANKIAGAAFGALRGPDMAAAIREGRLEVDALMKSIAGSHDTINKAAKDTLTFSKGFAMLRNDVELALAPLGKGLGNSLAEFGNNLKPLLGLVKSLGSAFAALPGPVQVGTAAFAALTPLLGPELAAAIGLGVAAIDTLLGAWKDDFGGIRSFTERWLGWLQPALLYAWEQIVDQAKQVWGELTDFFGGLWDGLTKTVLPAVVDFGKAIIDNLLFPFQAFGQLLDKLPASVKNAFGPVKDLIAAFDPRNIALTIDAMGTAYKIEHPEYGQAPAGGGGGNKPKPRGGGGGGGDGSGNNWWDKKSEAQKEDESAQKRIAANARILQFLNRGEAVDVAKLAGEYLHLSASRLQEVVASQKQVDSAVKAAESRKTYMTDLGKLNAEIRRLAAGHDAEAAGVDALKEKYPGLSNAMLTAMNNAIQWKKHLVEMREEAHKAAEAIRGMQVNILESGAEGRLAETAARLFGPKLLEQGKQPKNAQDLLKNYLTPDQQSKAVKAAGTGAFDTLDAQVKEQRRSLFTNYGELKTGGIGLKDRAAQALSGAIGENAGEYLSNSQLKVLGDKSRELIQLKDAATQAAAAQSVYDAEWGKFNTVVGTAGVNFEVLQKQFAGLTSRSALTREVMQQFGVSLRDLPKATQDALRASSELVRGLKFVQDFAAGVEGVFQGMFSNLFQHGFKGFFSSVVQGFDQMLQKMASDYLSSQLSNVFMNLLGPLLGSAFGGGGGVGGAGDIASAGLSGGAAAALSQPIPAFASGGSYSGGPMWVGEHGKELIFPHSSGTVIPHAQSMAMAGAGGQTNHITINVHGVTDAGSFQAPQNRHAITESLARELAKASARRR